jgi:hypothetical protein
MIKLTPIIDSIQFIEMSDEEYFSSKWADYISNSRLSLINPDQGGSDNKFLEGLSNNNIYSDSLSLGSAVHQLILQPNDFEVAEGVDRPTAKMGAMADELYKLFKDGKIIKDEDVIEASNKVGYYKDKMTEKKIQDVFNKCKQYWSDRQLWESKPMDKEPIYLDLKSREKLAQCVTNIENNSQIQKLLHPEGIIDTPISMNEAALFMEIKAEYEDKECILKLKGKLDNFTIDFETNSVVLNDLKTTGHYLTHFEESFAKYHYNRQMAFYIWMLTLYIKKQYNMNIDSLTANMLLVSTVPDFRAGVFKVSKNEISKGFSEFSELLKKVAYLYINGSNGSMGTNIL